MTEEEMSHFSCRQELKAERIMRESREREIARLNREISALRRQLDEHTQLLRITA